MLKNPCSQKVEYGLLYHLEKSDKKYFVSDSIGTIMLKATGKYRLIADFAGIDQSVNLIKGVNIDTLYSKKIQQCYDLISHPRFSGYCCCDDVCNGLQKDYYNDGTLRIERVFKDGKAIGKVKVYHSNGNISEIRIYNKKGVLRRTKKYDENGERI